MPRCAGVINEEWRSSADLSMQRWPEPGLEPGIGQLRIFDSWLMNYSSHRFFAYVLYQGRPKKKSLNRYLVGASMG